MKTQNSAQIIWDLSSLSAKVREMRIVEAEFRIEIYNIYNSDIALDCIHLGAGLEHWKPKLYQARQHEGKLLKLETHQGKDTSEGMPMSLRDPFLPKLALLRLNPPRWRVLAITLLFPCMDKQGSFYKAQEGIENGVFDVTSIYIYIHPYLCQDVKPGLMVSTS
jgi:hypothetical protein